MTAQELKNSILQMAVQGKLVPQDPTDEPASVLMERIHAEKERLIREGKTKREKAPSVIFRGADNTPYEKVGDAEPVSIADELPFDIPDTWEWVRLMDICEYIQRGKSPKYSPIERIPVIAQKCNQWSGFSIDKAQFIEPDTLSSYGIERYLQDDDLMWNSTGLGTLGRIAIYKSALNPYGIAVADSHITVIRPFKMFVLTEFLYYYFANPSVQNVIEDQADGTTKQKELATATVKAYLVPLPPYAEQIRILEKLHDVLPVVQHYGIVESTCARLNHEFPDQLRKSILQLAIQGKLVPQDPLDEPASVLLEQIRAEKERLIAAGKIKRDKHESVIFRRDNSHYEKRDGEERCIDEEIPFDIPETWAWCRLREALLQASTGPFGTMLHKDDYTAQGVPLVNPANIVNQAISVQSIKYVSTATAERLSSYTLHTGDVIIGRRGEMGRSAVVQTANDGWLCGTGCFFVKTQVSLLPEYLVFLLASSYLQSVLMNQSIGTTMNNLNHNILSELLIPLPPVCEQRRIMDGYCGITRLLSS